MSIHRGHLIQGSTILYRCCDEYTIVGEVRSRLLIEIGTIGSRPSSGRWGHLSLKTSPMGGYGRENIGRRTYSWRNNLWDPLVFVNFSAQDASILKISVPISKRRSWGFQNTPNLRSSDYFEPSYGTSKKAMFWLPFSNLQSKLFWDIFIFFKLA